MTLSAGERLGHYEILGTLGAGGMGEVYRARDPRLGREVAIKVSAERFSERFEREARVVASLNHPNICTLFDVGPNFLVMELVEGPTLAERIQQGPIPVDEALGIARQIADALDAAHEKGIVHRDLKPGNVKLRSDGAAKVLDFGLAKVGADSTAPDQNSRTMTIGETKAGMILGTAAYMAPEQARGKPVDKRADIWAFGVVLYEMITGKGAFQGDSMADLLAAVVMTEPPWELVPLKLHRLLKRCLEKDPKKRLRDIGDAMALVEDVPQPAIAAAPTAKRYSWPAWAVAGASAAAAIGLAIIHFRVTPPPPPQPVRFQISTPVLPGGNNFYMPVSPDGRKLAYTAAGTDGARRLWVRDMETLDSRMLSGTENAVSPFWSPDSHYLAFGVGNALKKVDASGASPPQTLCQSSSAVGSGSWSAEGVILFGGRGSGALQRVSAAGGTPVPVTALSSNDTFHTFPVFLPDGRRFLYLRGGSQDSLGIYAGSLDSKPGEQPSKRVMESRLGIAFVPSTDSAGGRLLFVRDATLMAQSFDVRRLELTGDPVPIAERVASSGSAGWFSVSSTGVVAYRTGGGTNVSQLAWYDRKGNQLGRVGEPAAYTDLALSPNADRLAFSIAGPQQALWILEFARGVSTRFTFDPAAYRYPIWSPDGSTIVFSSARQGRLDLYLKPSNGTVQEQVLVDSPEAKAASHWSRDGRFLLYSATDPKTRTDVWILPMQSADGQRKPLPLLQTPFQETQAEFSPDVKWVGYLSDESGRYETYVRPFIAAGPSGTPSLGEGKWQVSKDGAQGVAWPESGKELILLGRDGTVYSVEVGTTPSFHTGVAQPLFSVPAGASSITVSRDGKKFLLAVSSAPEKPEPITVLLNWDAALRKSGQ